jgi:hypothetical protein
MNNSFKRISEILVREREGISFTVVILRKQFPRRGSSTSRQKDPTYAWVNGIMVNPEPATVRSDV